MSDKNAFDEQKTENAAGKALRGIKNWLNEEGAASREDYAELRRLKKNPKYK